MQSLLPLRRVAPSATNTPNLFILAGISPKNRQLISAVSSLSKKWMLWAILWRPTMGYDIWYTLNIHGPKSKEEEIKIIADLRKSYAEAEWTFDENGLTNEPSHWYEAEDDLALFSKKYPNTLFELIFEGEDHEDLGTFFIRNGEKSGGNACIIYPVCPSRWEVPTPEGEFP
jgi:hypothetical protein